MSQFDKNAQVHDFHDGDIIAQILTGDKKAFELLMRKYNSRLYKIGMAIINEPAGVEDAMQTAYIKAYEHLSQFENKAHFNTWLTRILINECLLYLKKKQHAAGMKEQRNIEMVQEGVESNAAKSPINLLINKELGLALENALIQLPEKYRLVFVLREMEDMSIAETRDVLGITEVNVKVRLNRAKAMLRNTLASYYKKDNIFELHLSRCDKIVHSVFQMLDNPGF